MSVISKMQSFVDARQSASPSDIECWITILTNLEAALSHQGKVVPVTELANLASYWEDGGDRTGMDYGNALQECANNLTALISKAEKV